MNHSPEPRGGGFGSRPYDPLHPSEIPETPKVEGAFGLTQKEVDRLRDILRRECGVELTNQEAWARAIELVGLARMLAEMPEWPGERSSPPEPESSGSQTLSPTQG